MPERAISGRLWTAIVSAAVALPIGIAVFLSGETEQYKACEQVLYTYPVPGVIVREFYAPGTYLIRLESGHEVWVDAEHLARAGRATRGRTGRR